MLARSVVVAIGICLVCIAAAASPSPPSTAPVRQATRTPEAPARQRRLAIRDSHGLVALRRLPGNLRYLKITGLTWTTDDTGPAYDDAMRFLHDSDAILLDLRGSDADPAAMPALVARTGELRLYVLGQGRVTIWDGAEPASTIAAPAGSELEVAELHALDRLATRRGGASEELAWARVAVAAKLHPPTVTAAQLATHAGRYGELDIIARDGGLWLRRANRPEAKLLALTADGLFGVEGSDWLRVRFAASGVELLAPGQPARGFVRGPALSGALARAR